MSWFVVVANESKVCVMARHDVADICLQVYMTLSQATRDRAVILCASNADSARWRAAEEMRRLNDARQPEPPRQAPARARHVWSSKNMMDRLEA